MIFTSRYVKYEEARPLRHITLYKSTIKHIFKIKCYFFFSQYKFSSIFSCLLTVKYQNPALIHNTSWQYFLLFFQTLISLHKHTFGASFSKALEQFMIVSFTIKFAVIENNGGRHFNRPKTSFKIGQLI